MGYIKRIFLFLVLNFFIVMSISIVMSVLGVQPYLQASGLSYKALAIFCFCWGMIGAGISLALSKKMALWMMQVQIISDYNTPYGFLLSHVEALAKKANLPTPEVGVYQGKEVNAFATGPTKKRSLIAISQGALDTLAIEEIEGILAHEMAHIKNGDMVTMTLLQGVVNAFVMFFARVLAYAVSNLGKEGKKGSYLTYILSLYFFEFVFMILGSLIVCGFSRFREYKADAGGAKLAGKRKMILALEALLDKERTIKGPVSEEKAAFSMLKISASGKKSWLRFFASHPPLQQRIARLQKEA